MRVAYLVNQYPHVSHSFIRREIRAVERCGQPVFRIALRGWDDKPRGLEDQGELTRTRYVLQGGGGRLVAAFLWALAKRPMRMLGALKLVWKIGRRADRPLAVHFIYLFEACLVIRWLEAERIEHLHTHFGTNATEIAMLAHELGGPPFSFTVHGPEEFDKPHLIALPEKIKRARFVVAISSFCRSQLYRYADYGHWNKIKIVRCGLEQSFYEGLKQAATSASNQLVCVGRLCEQKGQLLLIEAVQKLSRRGIRFKLVLAGDGEMREEIERLIAAYALKEVVRITGWITSEEVRDEILGSRALVLPSFAEGLPVVLMEAMALKRPVITTYVAGIPELVEHSRHGWLIPAGDVEALAAALEACLKTSSDELLQMGEQAHHKVVEHHDIDREAHKLCALLAGKCPPV